MGWFARHKRHGIVLALIALALQFLLAFDHVHVPGLAQNSRLALTLRTAASQSAPQAPANPTDDDGYCAICVTIFLASSAFAAVPPQLLPPAKFQRVEHSASAAAALAKSPRLAFRSRAPPAA
jgi:hypothetical protein